MHRRRKSRSDPIPLPLLLQRLEEAIAPDTYRADQPLPAQVTDHLPGAPGKLAVLAERAARGEQLFHPRDAKLPPPS
jgi:hypothetical protein